MLGRLASRERGGSIIYLLMIFSFRIEEEKKRLRRRGLDQIL